MTLGFSLMSTTREYPNLGYSISGYSVSGMNIDANKICGRCLAQLREKAGLTQVELAKRLTVPQSFVSKVETGERSLRAYELFDYAYALGVDVHSVVSCLGSALGDIGRR